MPPPGTPTGRTWQGCWNSPGCRNLAQQAARAFELETQIAAAHWDKVRTRDMVQMYFPQTWPDFTAATPTLAWDQFLAGAELPESAVAEVINCQRTFLGEVAPLVVVDRLEDWRAWARWQLVDASPLPFLRPRRAELRLLRPDATGHSGAPGTLEAWRQPGRGGLGRGCGRLYVAEHSPPQTKALADELVANLLEAYRRSITDLAWMTDQTRVEALDKLAKFRAKIGYPGKWRDYSALQLQADDLLGNVLRAESFAFDYMIDNCPARSTRKSG